MRTDVKKISAVIVFLLLLTLFAPRTRARIIFETEYLLENSGSAWIIDSTDDVTGDLTLQFGNALGETLTWNSGTTSFDLSDDLNITGGITVSDTLTANGPVILGDGGDTLAIDSSVWDITVAGSLEGITGTDAITENAIEAVIFDADAENITGVWEIQDNITLTFGNDADISIQYDETNDDRLEISGVNGTLIEKTGAGLSLQVNDTAGDTTPFVVNGGGEVGIGTSTPVRPLHIVRSGDNFGADYAGAHFESTGTTGYGPSLNLDAASYAGGTEFYIASTGLQEPGGVGNLIIYDLTNTATRFLIDTDGEIGINGETAPAAPLDFGGTGQAIEIGDGTAADHYITFDDGTDRSFGWDDNYSANHAGGVFTINDEELAFRTIQSSSAPIACGAGNAGMQWMDTDTGILYICDPVRTKWLSPDEAVIFGEESGTCNAGSDPGGPDGCNVDWGNGLGPDGSSDLGFYIPHPITITSYGFSQDNDACTSGSYDLEIWSTGANNDDNNYTLEQTIASGLTDETANSNSLDINIAGDQYILWGIDNNCGQRIDDWAMIVYYRLRHD